jgi:hypothetical protein
MKKTLSELANLTNCITVRTNNPSSPSFTIDGSKLPKSSLFTISNNGKARYLRSAIKSLGITELVLPDVLDFKWIRGTLAFALHGVKTRERGGRTRVCTLVMVLGGTRANIPEALLEIFRKWHGSIDNQIDNIKHATDLLLSNREKWPVPQAVVTYITDAKPKLIEMIHDCRTATASPELRMRRNALLKTTVGYFLFTVKNWAYGQLIEGALTIEDVHSLGFLLAGERSGGRARSLGTLAIAQVKVRVNDEDTIVVVVDKSYAENAALVSSGWPTDARMALIVIKDSDGKEIYREMTTHLHNEITMPEGSRGKLFMIKASFMKHVDDKPHFGNEPTFSMPLTTEDLAAILDRQHHEEFEEHLRAVDQHRRDVEHLEAELAAAKAKLDAETTGN